MPVQAPRRLAEARDFAGERVRLAAGEPPEDLRRAGEEPLAGVERQVEKGIAGFEQAQCHAADGGRDVVAADAVAVAREDVESSSRPEEVVRRQIRRVEDAEGTSRGRGRAVEDA